MHWTKLIVHYIIYSRSLFVIYFRIICSHVSFILIIRWWFLFHESKNVSHPNVSFLNQNYNWIIIVVQSRWIKGLQLNHLRYQYIFFLKICVKSTCSITHIRRPPIWLSLSISSLFRFVWHRFVWHTGTKTATGIFCVLTVINFQNLECTTWWLTVHKITQNSTCSSQNNSFNNFKLLQLFLPAGCIYW